MAEPNFLERKLLEQNVDPFTFGTSLLASAGQGNVGANLGQALFQGRQQRISEASKAAEAAAAAKKQQSELEKYQSEQILKAQKEGFMAPTFTGTGYGMEALQKDPNAPASLTGRVGTTPQEYYNPETKQFGSLLTSNTGEQYINIVGGGQIPIAQAGGFVPKDTIPEFKANTAAAVTKAEEFEKIKAEAVKALPKTAQRVEEVNKLIKGIKTHPGLPELLSSGGAAGLVPFTDARDAAKRIDQLVKTAHVEAFESLKGGGQITEGEREAAAAALQRMDSLTVGSAEWLAALNEYETHINRGFELMQNTASGKIEGLNQGFSEAALYYLNQKK